jgi:hypothetical protein
VSGCRICGTNDHESMIETLAATLWQSRMVALDLGPPGRWEDESETWRACFRELAHTAVAHLERH